jgi:SNF2 family DNA or RNA helicase
MKRAIQMQQGRTRINFHLIYISINSIRMTRVISTYLLSMISYLRQSLVCALIPVARLSLNLADHAERSNLSHCIMNEINKLHLQEWMNNEQAAQSTRIQQCVKTIQHHSEARIVLFTSFRTCLNLLRYYITKHFPERNVYAMESSMSVQKRDETIKQFALSANGIILLTYDIGAQGLNLQAGSVCILVDMWWNAAKTIQAIGRILRMGQQNKEIFIYQYTSNTGIEKAILVSL